MARRLTARPTSDGRHPKWKHLIMVEIDPHYGMYIARSPAAPGKSALVGEDDVREMDPELADREFAYVPDDYLVIFEGGDDDATE